MQKQGFEECVIGSEVAAMQRQHLRSGQTRSDQRSGSVGLVRMAHNAFE